MYLREKYLNCLHTTWSIGLQFPLKTASILLICSLVSVKWEVEARPWLCWGVGAHRRSASANQRCAKCVSTGTWVAYCLSFVIMVKMLTWGFSVWRGTFSGVGWVSCCGRESLVMYAKWCIWLFMVCISNFLRRAWPKELIGIVAHDLRH